MHLGIHVSLVTLERSASLETLIKLDLVLDKKVSFTIKPTPVVELL